MQCKVSKDASLHSGCVALIQSDVKTHPTGTLQRFRISGYLRARLSRQLPRHAEISVFYVEKAFVMLVASSQVSRTRTRSEWAYSIGMFLARLAEIERQTHYIRLLWNAAAEGVTDPISLKKLSKNWVNLSFEERLDKLVAEVARSEHQTEFLTYFDKTKALLDLRNVLSHGTFAMKDGSNPEAPNYCIWCFPEKTDPDAKTDRPSRDDVVHIEQLEESMTDALDVIFGLDSLIKSFSKGRDIDVSETSNQHLSPEQRHASSMLQLNTGLLMVAMAEIEWMTINIYQSILHPEYDDLSSSPKRKLDGYWLSSTLKMKVDDLLKKLPKTGEHLFLMEVLREVRDLIAVRNTLAHSIIRYEISDTGALQLAAIRHVRQGLEKIPKKEVLAQIKKSMELSNKLSEAIARVSFQLIRERRSRPNLNGDIDSGTGSISNKSGDAS